MAEDLALFIQRMELVNANDDELETAIEQLKLVLYKYINNAGKTI